MNWYEPIFELIDLRSFSNLWYWIGLAVLWSSASHFALGVPYDLVGRARREGGDAMKDVEDLARINARRFEQIIQVAGMGIIGFATFLLTLWGVLGFGYDSEFSQAVFLLGFPMFFVSWVNYRSAKRVLLERATGDHLCRIITRCRIYTQLIGVVAIFITSLWGMYQNVTANVLGG